MKILMPIGIALLGLGAGVGAGVALKPAPEAPAAAACADSEAAHAGEGLPEGEAGQEAAAPHGGAAAAGACDAAAADPFAPAPKAEESHEKPPAVVTLDRPFVVPVFEGEKVVAMIVASVAVEIDAEGETAVEAAQPRLRDSFLAAMFRHANSGGFDGAFTTGRKMDDLRSALLVAARAVFAGVTVSDVLITEIARQDV